MADSVFNDNMLEGLDISLLTKKDGEGNQKVEESTEPSVFKPALEIKEVEELPVEKEKEVEDKKEEVKETPKEDTKVTEKPLEIIDEGAPETSEATSDTSNSPLRVFAEMQRDKGLIEFEDDEFEDSEEFLLKKVKNSINSGITSYKDALPPEIKYLVDNYEEGVPFSELLQLASAQQEYESINPEYVKSDPEIQKALVKDLLLRSGWSQAKVNQKVTRYVDSGVLEDEALDALNTLQDAQKIEKERYVASQKQENENKKAAYDKWLGDLKTHIDDKDEIISGIKLTPKQKKDLYSNITKVDREGKNQVLKMREKDPEFDLKVAYLATVLQWDFSAISRKSKTKATRSLVDSLSTPKPNQNTSSENETVDYSVMRKSMI